MSKIADTEANATSLDGLVNDNGLIPTLRNGPKPSYQYLVDGWTGEINDLLDRTNGVGRDNAWSDTAEALRDTVDGDYFSVVSSDDNSYLDLYKNESGVAVYKKSYPSSEYVNGILDPITEKTYNDNLFKSSEYLDDYFINTSGNAQSSVGFTTSGFIEAEPNKIYSSRDRSTILRLFQYDASKNYIGTYKQNSPFDAGNQTSATTAFIRGYATTSVMQSVTLFPYDYYKNIIPPSSPVTNVDLTNKVNLTVSAGETSFVTALDKINLLNPDEIVENYILNSTGNYSATNGWFVSGFIHVESDTTYTSNGARFLHEYDIDKNILTTGTGNSGPLTTTSNTAFIQTYDALVNLEKLSIVEGGEEVDLTSENKYKFDGLVTDDTWYGKTITWMGTSIPAGSGYPESVANNMYCKLNNISVGGMRVRAFDDSGNWFSQSIQNLLFSLTKSDVNARYGENLGELVSPTNYLTLDPSGVELTQELLDALTVFSAETRLTPLIQDTDLFVLDFGINDRNGQSTFPFLSPEDSGYDRKEFAGAMGYIIKLIIDAKPDARIVMVTHYTNYSGLSPNASFVVDAQLEIANYWNIPVLNMTEFSGCNQLTISNLTSDNLHPIENGILSDRYVKAFIDKMSAINI